VRAHKALLTPKGVAAAAAAAPPQGVRPGSRQADRQRRERQQSEREQIQREAEAYEKQKQQRYEGGQQRWAIPTPTHDRKHHAGRDR
jgi:hypothetical protein